MMTKRSHHIPTFTSRAATHMIRRLVRAFLNQKMLRHHHVAEHHQPVDGGEADRAGAL